MSKFMEGYFNPLKDFDPYPASKVGAAIREKYGIEVFRKTAEEEVFCCFVKIHSDGKDYAIIDWERKRSDYKDEGEYKEAIKEILRSLNLMI